MSLLLDALGPLRENRRLRIGLALIVWILAVNALIDWRDHLAAQQQAYRQSLSQLARLTPGQPLAVWQQRAADGAQALQAARALLWQNASAGRAQAQVQDSLNEALRRAAAQGVNIRVAEPDPQAARSAASAPAIGALARVRPLRARVEFNTDPAVMLALLAAFNDAEHRIVVDALSVKPARTELSVTFWYELSEVATNPAAAANNRVPR